MAALDFPNAPTVGQIFSGPGGIQWMWDGIKWIVVGAGPAYATTTYVQAAVAPALNNVGRNKLHNGLFNIQQRGQGPWTSSYTADRWGLGITNDTASATLVATSDTDRSQIGDEEAGTYLQNAFTGSATAGSYTVISQRIEYVRRLSGKIVTVSFWAKASVGTPALGVGLQQNFGSGGSPSPTVHVTGASTGALTSTWMRYSQQITVPSAAGKTFGTTAATDYTQFDIWYSSTTNGFDDAPPIGQQSGTVQIWGVQLEVADAVTPLEKPDIRYDFANCQRFYQFTSGLQTSASVSAGGIASTACITFPRMRAQPTATPSSVSYSNASALVITPTGPSVVQTFFSASGAGNAWAVFNLALAADL